MRLLYDSALDSWLRVKNLDRRLQEPQSPNTRLQLERKRRAAVNQFRRNFVEQQVRLRAA